MNEAEGCLQSDNSDTEELVEKIRRHCLFPVLKVLLLQCEDSLDNLDKVSNDVLNCRIKKEIKNAQSFFLSPNSELDHLMLLAVQVLRIHLMELDKTKELTSDFCERYAISESVRLKMGPEYLLGYDDKESDSRHCSEEVATIQTPDGSLVSLHMPTGENVKSALPALKIDRVDLDEHISMLQSQNGLLLTSKELKCEEMSSDAEEPCSSDSIGPLSPEASNNKKTALPKAATDVLRKWLFQHIVHPYPSEDEKAQLALETNLSLIQVNNWFINARRRILQPCLSQIHANKDHHLKRPPKAVHSAHKNWQWANDHHLLMASTSPPPSGLTDSSTSRNGHIEQNRPYDEAEQDDLQEQSPPTNNGCLMVGSLDARSPTNKRSLNSLPDEELST